MCCMKGDGDVSAPMLPNEDVDPLTAVWLPILWKRRGKLLLILDALTVFSAFMLAYYLRFHLEFLAIKSIAVESVVAYLKGAALLAAVWCYLIRRSGGYENELRGNDGLRLGARDVVLNGVFAMGVLMAISFMYRSLLLSRQVYLMTGVLGGGMMLLVRLLFAALGHDLAQQGIVAQKVLVVGLDSQAKSFARQLSGMGHAISVIGFLADNPAAQEETAAVAPVLGGRHDYDTLHARYHYDRIVMTNAMVGANDERTASWMITLINFCEANEVSLYMLPNVMDVAVRQDELGSLSGIPIVRVRDAALQPGYAIVKRVMDVLIALSVLIGGAPLWLAVAILIKTTSRGPVFFKQVRAGLHGQPFTMYKFRSMVADAESRLKDLVDLDDLDEPVFKLKNDPRVTGIGRFLRRTSLDEIPQFINVLIGEMSTVGPRPEERKLVEQYTPWQRRRLKAKPGITGFQQIMNRGEPLLKERVKYDLIYLKQQSLLCDLYIIGRTFAVVTLGSGVTH